MRVEITDANDGAMALAQHTLELERPDAIPQEQRQRWANHLAEIRQRRALDAELDRDVRGDRDGYWPPKVA